MPFLYPTNPLVRRHGPQGYRDYTSYQPWLRDEFRFRCVFCLRREQWDLATSLQVDHFLPTSQFPEQSFDYDNLLYCCGRCNLTKGNQSTPDPCSNLLRNRVTALHDGTLEARDTLTVQLISQLRLNSPEMVHFRRLWLEIIAMARIANPRLYRELMSYPSELPDLRKLRPSGGNTRPTGVEDSYLVKRERGELPNSY